MSAIAANTRIRPARPGDEHRLLLIDTPLQADTGREQLFARACGVVAGARECALVLLVDDTIEGFVIYSQVLDEVSIHDVVVAPNSRRSGLGSQLLSHALQQLSSQGAQRCLLEVRESNSAARALYQRLSFHEDGVRANYYPAVNGREDAVLMSRQL